MSIHPGGASLAVSNQVPWR